MRRGTLGPTAPRPKPPRDMETVEPIPPWPCANEHGTHTTAASNAMLNRRNMAWDAPLTLKTLLLYPYSAKSKKCPACRQGIRTPNLRLLEYAEQKTQQTGSRRSGLYFYCWISSKEAGHGGHQDRSEGATSRLSSLHNSPFSFVLRPGKCISYPPPELNCQRESHKRYWTLITGAPRLPPQQLPV